MSQLFLLFRSRLQRPPSEWGSLVVQPSQAEDRVGACQSFPDLLPEVPVISPYAYFAQVLVVIQRFQILDP
ncbi:hypothetical protein LINPERHAP2_LOCUS17729 [Linum perenne]